MSSSEKSDADILRGCLESDSISWNLFVERYSKLVYWSIYETLKAQSIDDKSDHLKEIFQNIFRKLIEKEELKKIKEVSSLRKYLVVLATHATLDYVKMAQRFEKRATSTAVLEPDTEPSVDPKEVTLDNEKKRLIDEILATLPRRERVCIELCYLEGRTHREIGFLLNLPQDSVSTIIRRAKEKLRQRLEEKNR